MNMIFRSRFLLALAALAPIILVLQPVTLDAQTQSARKAPAQTPEKEKMHAWTVGIAGGLLEGAPLRLAAEMARVVDDGPNLHVLPIVTRAPPTT